MARIPATSAFIHDTAWGPPLPCIFICFGMFLALKTSFIQFSGFGFMMRETAGRVLKKRASSDDGDMSLFRAVTVAMGGTVGVENITGAGKNNCLSRVSGLKIRPDPHSVEDIKRHRRDR